MDIKTPNRPQPEQKPEQKPVIQLSGVSQSFIVGSDKADVLKDVNFALNDKTFNIVYGQSGSGKSTLLNVLTGLQKPTTGNVVFAGKALYKLDPDELAHFRANEIGIVYQDDFWVKSLNVIENVSMPLYFSGHSRSSAEGLAMGALEKVGMADKAKKHPALLSGGEQKLVVMARAIVNDPHFIIADEPTGSLDSVNGDKIMSLLKRFHTLLGRTIILVTHNMEYIPLADRLLRIEDGQVTDTKNDADITATANKLLLDMKKRIDSLARTERHV
jgi:putative ABC transport system ATP-binding protein